MTSAPVAAIKPTTSTHHGITRTENYAWLRADNWQEVMRNPDVLDTEIRAYLEAENEYTADYLKDTEELQEKLFAEMKGRIKEDDSSVPDKHGPYAYVSKYVTGGQHPLYVRTPREGGEEQVLIDGNALADGKAYFKLAMTNHSSDHKLIAWSYDDKGSEFFTVKVRDIENDNDLEDVLENTSGGAVWANDNRTLFYTEVDENHRPCRVKRHVLGTPVSEDVLVYEESDPGFFIGVGKTSADKFIVIDCHDHQTSETYLIPADTPDAAPQMMAARQTEIEYHVDDLDAETLVIRTNLDGAADFKLMTAPNSAPSRDNWQEYEPYEEGRVIKYTSTYKNHLVWMETRNALPRIVVKRLSDGETHEIAFEEEAYSLGLSGGLEYDTSEMRFSYSSMTTPSRTYDYDMQTRERTLRKEQEVPSGHEASDYITRRIHAKSHDGTEVPVSVLYHKDTKLDGTAPCLLYGYGSYGMSMPASFSTARLSLVDRGFVYAIAHIRGGMEKGDAWYRGGKREHKTNTFKDFIAAGEHLAQENFTSSGKIIAEGGSAGGMLMGAVANMRPSLFGGIIAAVPFVDVLTTMLDDTLPLTPPEWPEWGNPIASKEDYETIAAYSPIDNVTAQDYPPILALGGLTDPRVTYWEPAKWVATLRATQTGHNPVLLKTNMDAGHGGASGRFDRLKEVALEYAFALKNSNISN